MKKPKSIESMTFAQVRRLAITALCSDDVLFDQLVLKGGNAMSLVHGISSRASIDLDFSLEQDFVDLKDVHRRISQALIKRFAPFGLVPLDVKLFAKPSKPGEDVSPHWGGYKLMFKLIDEERYRVLDEKALERVRREALVVGPGQLKVFEVDFSKWEYTGGKTKAELDDYTIYVYSPAMIAVEKLRAICQQMEDYHLLGRAKRPRAKDFYDIYIIVKKTGFCFENPDSLELTRLIFAAKDVPLTLLGKIKDQREYHRDDWPSVRDAVPDTLEEFDHYFEFVVREIEPLHALWMK